MLRENELADGGALALAPGLATLGSLAELDLCQNEARAWSHTMLLYALGRRCRTAAHRGRAWVAGLGALVALQTSVRTRRGVVQFTVQFTVHFTVQFTALGDQCTALGVLAKLGVCENHARALTGALLCLSW